MFDFGFSQLLIIAVVALIVVGPRRLPTVARTAGHLLGRMRRYVTDVKADISREMQLDELKKLQQQVQDEARDLENSMRKQMDGVKSEVRESAQVVERDLNDTLAASKTKTKDVSTKDTPPAALPEADEGSATSDAASRIDAPALDAGVPVEDTPRSDTVAAAPEPEADTRASRTDNKH